MSSAKDYLQKEEKLTRYITNIFIQNVIYLVYSSLLRQSLRIWNTYKCGKRIFWEKLFRFLFITCKFFDPHKPPFLPYSIFSLYWFFWCSEMIVKINNTKDEYFLQNKKTISIFLKRGPLFSLIKIQTFFNYQKGKWSKITELHLSLECFKSTWNICCHAVVDKTYLCNLFTTYNLISKY